MRDILSLQRVSAHLQRTPAQRRERRLSQLRTKADKGLIVCRLSHSK